MKQHFKNIIKQIACTSSSAPFDIVSLLSAEAMENYPSYLYKYRSCENEYNFDMLDEEYLWADYPASFDDPFDAIVNHKLKTELKDIEKWLFIHLGEIMYYSIPPKGMANSKHGQTLAQYMKAQKHFVDENGKVNSKSAIKAMKSEIVKLPYEKQQKVLKAYKDFESPEFEKGIDDAIRKMLSGVVNSLREKTMMICLTTRRDNQKMWENYGGNYSGFVIEYKRPCFDDLNADQKQIIASLFPVSYYKRSPQVPLLPFIEFVFHRDLYGKTIDISEAQEKLYCQLLYKKKEYNSEEEWRIVLQANNHKIDFPYVSAVYAGNKIKDEDFETLKKKCQKKGIPLFKQEFNLFTHTMEFKPVSECNDEFCERSIHD